jgi:hypothetical protein
MIGQWENYVDTEVLGKGRQQWKGFSDIPFLPQMNEQTREMTMTVRE